MPAYDSGRDCIVTEIYQNAVELSTDTEVIAQLSRDNHALNVTLTNLSESFDMLHRTIARLEEEKEDMVPKHHFEKLIVHALGSGEIPLPVGYSPGTCEFKIMIKESSLGVDADVTFSKGEKTVTLLFEFVPLPATCKENEDYYPDFQIRYSKPKVAKKTSKTKSSTPSVISQESGCSGNPS